MSSIDKKINKLMDAIISMDAKIDMRMDTLEKQNQSLIEEFKTVRKDVMIIFEKQEILVGEMNDLKIEIETMKQQALYNDIIIIIMFPSLQIKQILLTYYKLLLKSLE